MDVTKHIEESALAACGVHDSSCYVFGLRQISANRIVGIRFLIDN